MKRYDLRQKNLIFFKKRKMAMEMKNAIKIHTEIKKAQN